MFITEIINLFVNRKKLWLAITLFWLFVIVISSYLLLPEITGKQIASLEDFVVALLTQQFFTLVLVPVSYIIITVDLIKIDFNDKRIHLLLNRVGSRSIWVLSKFFTFCILAFLHTFIAIVISCIAALYNGYSFGGEICYPLLKEFISQGFNNYVILLLLFVNYVLSLAAFAGVIVLFYLCIKKNVIVFFSYLFMCFANYFFFKFNPDIVLWFPPAHIKFDLHQPYVLLSASNPDSRVISQIASPSFFTVKFSWVLLITIFIASLAFSLIRVRSMQIK